MQETISSPFYFKQFEIKQHLSAMKVGTDGVLLGAWANVENTKYALDIGTGTGIIAIMLAQRTSSAATIHGIEIDDAAAMQASENMAKSPWAAQLQSFHLPIQEYAKNTKIKYDLIVSNPPFFTGGTLSSNQNKSNVRHTIKLPHNELLQATRLLLHENGKFCVILPLIEGLRFKEMAETYRFHCTKMTEICGRRDKQVERLLLQFETKMKPIEKNTLAIYEKNNEYSAEYIALTGGFYLNM